ncbi:MAG: YifB family Mg chelatase-like AAA ATPase [Patescibacteria group bacterium]
MPSKIYSVALSGLDGQLVEIEVDTRMSIPSFSIVGLPDAAVMEAKERVMSAVKNAGLPLPRGRIVVNLAPADLKKVGPRYDLPIALGLIAFSNLILDSSFKDTVFLGELALDGKVRPITGILVSTEFARRQGFKRIVVPKENAQEAAIIKGIQIIPVGHLKEAILYLNEQLYPLPIIPKVIEADPTATVDMSMVKGQAQAKRALEIAAAGGHNVLMKGAPGAGKTLMARALQGILPDMTQEEMLEVTRIYSVAGQLPQSQSLVSVRPFRVIHHTASAVSIVGGGSVPMPGEITLAHRGVLFLDEVAEFPQEVLNVLRQPIEDGHITVSRAKATVTYPAKFCLVAAMNPCPCGYFGVEKHKGRCTCLRWKIKNYHQRLSGPFLDRIDIHLEVKPVEHAALIQSVTGTETSAEVRKRVNEAYRKQIERFKAHNITRNAEMNTSQIEKYCVLDAESKNLLHVAIDHLKFSARAYYRAIKMSRTIADLDNQERIHPRHVSEAIQYLFKKRF